MSKFSAKFTASGFVLEARRRWGTSFTLIRRFLDWASENGYESVQAIGQSKIKDHYSNKVLLGYGSSEIYGKQVSILGSLGWCSRQVPEELQLEIYKSALNLIRKQMQFKQLEPENILAGINLTCGSVLCSVLGINQETYDQTKDGPLGKFQKTKKRLVLASERTDSSFKLVEPIISLVEGILREETAQE